jgi:epsin
MGARSGGFGGSGNKYGGFGSDQVRSGGFSRNDHDSYDRSNYNHHDSSPDRATYNHHESSRVETRPEYSTIAQQPRTESKPQAQEANLLDFNDDFADFSSAPPVSNSVAPQNDFADFMTAPATQPQSIPPHTFSSAPVAAPSASASYGKFGSAPVQPLKAPSPNQQSFANFGANTLASMNSTSPKQPSFANFGQFPTSTQPVGNHSQPASFGTFSSSKPPINDDFGDFQASSAQADPISKLVSLDAFSLGSNAKKEQTGPSLNSLATPKSTFQMK